MNVLILGDGALERAWASWFLAHPEHPLKALYPGFTGVDIAEARVAVDLDEALATAGIELVVVGGSLPFRGEALRRSAAEGLAIICIHPPGNRLRGVLSGCTQPGGNGRGRRARHPAAPPSRSCTAATGHRARRARFLSSCPPRVRMPTRTKTTAILPATDFPRMVDVVRALLGEIEATTASGDPPGDHPDIELVVQLRGARGRKGARSASGPDRRNRLAWVSTVPRAP